MQNDDIDLFDCLTSLYFPVAGDYETLLRRIFRQVKQVSIAIVTGQKEILTASVTSVMTYTYSSKLQFCLFTRSPRAGFPRLIKVAKDWEYAKSNYNNVSVSPGGDAPNLASIVFEDAYILDPKMTIIGEILEEMSRLTGFASDQVDSRRR